MSLSTDELAVYFDYLRFPSISAAPAHQQDCRDCANWLVELLAKWGLASALHETDGHPIVLAHTARESSKQTLLIYGHYDVQPVEPLALWETPPFEPSLREGLVHARGATDNKGQTAALLIGLRRLLERGPLPVNLVIFIEGGEEIGSPYLADFISTHRPQIACDGVLVCDTSLVTAGWPAITLGLRGIVCLEILIHGPAKDLHSGIFGGATANPAQALSRILARATDADGRITIPGLYDDVLPVSNKELTSWQVLPWTAEWFTATTRCSAPTGEQNYSLLERVWARPTFEINGLTSGHQGSGSKTIIPTTALAKISLRLVPNQDPDVIAALVATWLNQQIAAEGFVGEVTIDHGGYPFFTPPENPLVHAAEIALTQTFGRAPAFTREGISIPIASLLQREMKVPIILAGLGLADCNAHSPNESFPISHLELGAQFLENYVAQLGSSAAPSHTTSPNELHS